MTCNELAAIRFTRKIINMPSSTMPDGKIDPGWCCQEHALAGTLAFSILGIKTHWCKGNLMIGPASGGNVMEVQPHEFVMLLNPTQGIFDSSVTHDHIRGIPMGYAPTYPDLKVCEFLGRSATTADFVNLAMKQQTGVLALYSVRTPLIPNSKVVEWKSTTPFGQWLTHRYGSQEGLWAKMAWRISEQFRQENNRLNTDLTKEDLWDQIAQGPNKDEFVADRITTTHSAN